MGWVGQYTAAVYRVEVEQVDKLHTPRRSARTAQPTARSPRTPRFSKYPSHLCIDRLPEAIEGLSRFAEECEFLRHQRTPLMRQPFLLEHLKVFRTVTVCLAVEAFRVEVFPLM